MEDKFVGCPNCGEEVQESDIIECIGCGAECCGNCVAGDFCYDCDMSADAEDDIFDDDIPEDDEEEL